MRIALVVVVVLGLGAFLLGGQRSAAVSPQPAQANGGTTSTAPAVQMAQATGALAADPKPPARDTSLQTFKVKQASSQFDLAGAKQVSIDNRYGNVHVKPGGPPVKVEEATYARGKDRAEAVKRAKAFRVTTKRDRKEGLRIVVEGNDKDMEVGTSIVVSVPAVVAVKVHAIGGDVRVDDFAANVTVDGSAGDVAIGKVKGKVGVSTAAGNISVAGAGNGLEVQTSSGELRLSGVNGPVTARTMSGGIILAVGRSDKIIATTMSGPINVTVSAPFSGSFEASSSRGDIRIALPRNSNCKVSTATGSGPTKCTLPLKGVKRNGPNYDAGHLGAGKGNVRVMNDSGAIELVPTK